MQLSVILSIVLLLACNPPVNAPSKPDSESGTELLQLDKLKLPEGFKIEMFASGVSNARSLDMSPDGTLFVGSRGAGNVYALVDEDGDWKADKQYIIYEDGNSPNGVAFRDGDLYVAEISRIIVFRDIEDKLTNPPDPEIVFDGYPSETHHGWKYIAFGPDGLLYVPVGAPCNICESENPVFNTITRLNVDTGEMEIVQRGIRNTVGITWHPVTQNMWFTDNGRDWMGDDLPACELNRAPEDNMHFGYPYCHQGDLPDPEFGDKRKCSEFTPPVQNLGPHVAPLGMEFYSGTQFPEKYVNQYAFIAEHGSWNRTNKIGYRITTVRLDSNYNSLGYEDFITGWLDESTDEVWGRPVDLEFLSDGSMLISDDFADAIYRVSYN